MIDEIIKDFQSLAEQHNAKLSPRRITGYGWQILLEKGLFKSACQVTDRSILAIGVHQAERCTKCREWMVTTPGMENSFDCEHDWKLETWEITPDRVVRSIRLMMERMFSKLREWETTVDTNEET